MALQSLFWFKVGNAQPVETLLCGIERLSARTADLISKTKWGGMYLGTPWNGDRRRFNCDYFHLKCPLILGRPMSDRHNTGQSRSWSEIFLANG